MAKLASLSDDNFDTEVLASDQPVLVDFSAEWCGPCRQLAPVVESLAEEYAGKVRFYAVDVDQARATAMRFGIASVPTLMVFKGGQVVAQLVGARPRAELAKTLDQVIAS
ncbi:MAG: thioredoxin [Acidobacteria bacterium]|nr:MAG: thioredoxin [Acidobacteriota bacterium]